MTAAEKKLKGIAERFAQFHEEFSPFFQTQTRDNSEIAGKYLSGLVQAQKKNMERIAAEKLQDAIDKAGGLEKFLKEEEKRENKK